MAENDYTLLRKLDLEAVVNGASICDSRGRTLTLDGATELLSQNGVEGLRLAPLFWLEGKPVYADSEVYAGSLGVVDGETAYLLDMLSVETLSWPATKVERTIEIYLDGEKVLFDTIKTTAGARPTAIIWGVE